MYLLRLPRRFVLKLSNELLERRAPLPSIVCPKAYVDQYTLNQHYSLQYLLSPYTVNMLIECLASHLCLLFIDFGKCCGQGQVLLYDVS